MTAPTNWPEIQEEDLCRLTISGVRALLELTGFEILRLESRWSIPFDGWEMSMGWGVVARA